MIGFSTLRVEASVPGIQWLATYDITGIPNDIAVDSTGNYYVTNYTYHRVEKYDHNGNFIGQFGSNGSGNGQFYRPDGIDIDADGNIYVADAGNERVQKFNSSFSWIWTSTYSFSYPNKLAVYGDRVYLNDYGDDSIVILDASDGSFIDKIIEDENLVDYFSYSFGVGVDNDGNVLGVDKFGNRIVRFTSGGEFIDRFGTRGYLAGQLYYPTSADVDDQGNIYVAEDTNNRVSIFTSNLEPLSPFGSTGTGNGHFTTPEGVAINSAGEIFVSDYGRTDVQKFAFTGTDYQIGNLSSNLDIINPVTNLNIELGELTGINNVAIDLRIKNTEGIPISDLTVDMTADRDWSNVEADTDRATGKAYVSNLIGAPGAGSEHTLYVQIPEGRTSNTVYICPDATSFSEINDSCTNGVERGEGSYSESFGNITVSYYSDFGDGIKYWKIEGLTGSGAMAYGFVEFSGSGSGTAFDPYVITSCTELQEMKDNRASDYILNNDIDCSDTINWNGGEGYEPVGHYPSEAFSGSLDGNSYTISNLYISRDSIGYEEDAMGLFGYVVGAELNNINLENVDLNGWYYMGALVGYAVDTDIFNCTASGSIGLYSADPWDSGEAIGGLIGGIEGTSSVSDSSTSVFIDFVGSPYELGGFVGLADGNISFSNCSATGDIVVGSDPYEVGGFAGTVGMWSESEIYIDNCYATGDIHTSNGAGYGDDATGGDGYWIGGFAGWVGQNEEASKAIITNSYATGNIIAEGNDNYWYGGFVGWLLGESEIRDSYATGSIDAIGEYNYWMGGFGGQLGGSSTIERTYSTGNLSGGYGTNGFGGYAGWIQVGDHGYVGNINISYSYSTGNITVLDEGYGIGGFVGWMGYAHTNPVQLEQITISYCYSTGNITAGIEGKEASWGGSMGGFVGFNENASTLPQKIEHSFTTTKIDTIGLIEGVGGFIGYVEGNLTIEQCASLGEYVEGYMNVGGFVGDSYYSTGWWGDSSGYLKLYKDSYSRTDVRSNYMDLNYPNDSFLGGFAGSQISEHDGADSVIENTYNTGVISLVENPIGDIDTDLSVTIDDETTVITVDDPTGIVPDSYLVLDEYEGTPYSTTLAAPVAIGAEYITVVDGSGFNPTYPYNQVIFEKGVEGKEDGPYQIRELNGNIIRFYVGDYARPAIAHDAGATIQFEPMDMREVVQVQEVNGNDLTVIREMAYTSSWEHLAGSTVRDYELPLLENMYAGGVIGDSTGTVTNSYWNIETSGLTTSAGGVGLTTAQMHDKDSYEDWDFDTTNIWNLNEQVNDNYPYLDFDDPTLSDLVPSIGVLQPAFNRNIFEYTLTVPLDTSEVSFTPTFFRSNPYLIRSADVEGTPIGNGVSTGSIPVPDASNEIEFNLESLSWRNATYTINVVKGDVPTPTPTPINPTPTPSNPTPTPTNPLPIVTTTVPTPSSRPGTSITPRPLCLYEYEEQCINELLITDVTTTVNGNTAIICWKTNIPSDDFINYSPESGALDQTTQLIEAEQVFCQTLTNLEYDQEYIFLINAAQGEMEAKHEGTFRTGSPSPEPVYSCAIYANPLSARYDGTTLTMNFTTDNADSCTMSWGSMQSNLDKRADISRSGQSFSSYFMLGNPVPASIYYRISCTSGTNQCTSSNRIDLASGSPAPGLDFFGIDLNFGPFEFLALTGLVFTITPISIAFPQFWLYGIAWIFPKKKQRPWGIVYDENRKNPIAFAVVRLFDQGGNMLKQVVTDLQGRFSFLADPGNYQISVEHSDYNKVFKNINILKDDSKIAENIGLVALEENKPLLATLRSNMGTFFMKTYWILGFIGMIFSFVAMVSNFEILNVIIFLVYVVQMVMMIMLRPKRDFGFVYDTTTGERIKGAFIQVQDVAQGRQVDVQMSDERGRFGFNLDKGEYLLIVKVGEKSPKTSDLQSVQLPDGSIGFKYDPSVKGFSFGFE